MTQIKIMSNYKKTLAKAVCFLVENPEFTKTELAKHLGIERKHLYDRILPELTGTPPEGMGLEIEKIGYKSNRVISYGIISVKKVKTAVSESSMAQG